jgi:hypothetical protein
MQRLLGVDGGGQDGGSSAQESMQRAMLVGPPLSCGQGLFVRESGAARCPAVMRVVDLAQGCRPACIPRLSRARLSVNTRRHHERDSARE